MCLCGGFCLSVYLFVSVCIACLAVCPHGLSTPSPNPARTFTLSTIASKSRFTCTLKWSHNIRTIGVRGTVVCSHCTFVHICEKLKRITRLAMYSYIFSGFVSSCLYVCVAVSFCLYTRSSVSQSVRPSVRSSIHPSVCLFVLLSVQALRLPECLRGGLGGKRGVRSAGVWKVRSVECAECGKCGVWKVRSVENEEGWIRGVWKMRSVENVECGKWGVWKMWSVENDNNKKWSKASVSPSMRSRVLKTLTNWIFDGWRRRD